MLQHCLLCNVRKHHSDPYFLKDWYETMSYDYEVQLQVEIDNFNT